MLPRIMTAVAIALVAAACARGPRATRDAAAGKAASDSVLVDVNNENYYAARIHAVWVGGQRRPLGTIDGNGGRAKVVIAWEPRALIFEILLVTDGSAYVSQTVDVTPADTVELRVPSNISASGFFRRVRR